ncbi:MAG: tRNA 2-thiouridine(34) synthase MnmA [Candidatus Paceibacterota bacterium]|jgi:tRNA-specific 2-thiouridylase
MSKDKKQLVFVGLSGGVDSAVTAGLLKEQGYQVVGVFMKCWDAASEGLCGIGCGWERDEEDARQVASKLAIPFYSWDFTKEYREKVINYFLDGYKKGITPNPDIECNREIKFGMFLKQALKMGADFVAAGHYIRLRRKLKVKSEKLKVNVYSLLKGVDGNKDQSYFLWTLTQKQLKHCLFPVGDYTKPEIRKIAAKWDLPVKDKPDSQGICFMGKVNVEDFLKQYIKSKPGKILTTDKEVIGKHDGLETYTIGQRRGIKIGGGIPYFVIGKDFKKNELIVAKGRKNEALFEEELIASDLSWISGEEPKFPLKCQAKIRYRQPDQECVIMINPPSLKLQRTKGKNQIKVTFKELQRAITPGQSIVFYKGEIMIGGGIIES